MSSFPPPPVPQKLMEFLSEYPECIAEISEALAAYAAKPNMLMPFDGAIWTIQGVLEDLALDAREASQLAKQRGDHAAQEAAAAKELRLLHAGTGLVGRLGGLRESMAKFCGTERPTSFPMSLGDVAHEALV